MKLVNGLKALALTAFIFSIQGCTTDGAEESVEAVEEDNQFPDQSEEGVDAELPTAEAASVEAEQGIETIDSSSYVDVQALATEQQIAVDEAAQAGVANGAGQELIAAPIPGEDPYLTPDAIAESPALPDYSTAEAEVPLASPEMPIDTAPPVPAMADIIDDSAAAQADAVPEAEEAEVKSSKKSSKRKRLAKSPTLNGNEKMYIVQPGDTLSKIAAAIYGTQGEWQNLAELNGINGKSKIFPGDALKYVPSEKTAAFESKVDSLPKATITVEKGDTLSKIATRVMGNASYWKMLWRWNEAAIPDANMIAVGMTLSYVSAKDLEAVSH